MATPDPVQNLRRLEGRQVNVALADGSRLDDCQLVSVARRGTSTLWLYSRQDVFVPLSKVIDIWEVAPFSRVA